LSPLTSEDKQVNTHPFISCRKPILSWTHLPAPNLFHYRYACGRTCTTTRL